MLPCQFKATAFHTHEQSHLKWFFQVKQVKSEQGWGRPEFCARCLLSIYSLGKQARASSRSPKPFGRCPGPHATHRHKARPHEVERNEEDERGGHQGSSDWCCWDPDLLQSSATSIHPESPSRNYAFPYTDPKETQPSSPTLVIRETSTKWLLTDVHFFPRQELNLVFPWFPEPTDVFCEEPSPAGVQMVLSESIYQIRPLARTFHYSVSRSQGELAGSSAAMLQYARQPHQPNWRQLKSFQVHQEGTRQTKVPPVPGTSGARSLGDYSFSPGRIEVLKSSFPCQILSPAYTILK